VGNIYQEVIEFGPDAVHERIQKMRGQVGYVIMDVVDQQSLKIIAEAVKDEPVLCGSSALAEELPGLWGVHTCFKTPVGLSKNNGSGILCVAGSLMPQTRRQIKILMEYGVPGFGLDTMELFSEHLRQNVLSKLTDQLCEVLSSGQDALLYSGADQDQVIQTQRKGRALGLTETEVSRIVSDSLAEISQRVLYAVDQIRFVVAGGETSDAVCERLNIKGLTMLEEIQPGLPSCLSIPDNNKEQAYLLVLKSGSFGDDDFLIQALDHIRRLE
jgi:uncharacterized protein YgbK (DUF1537 family)